MKSFQNFAYKIAEAEERIKTDPAKLNISQPILPMQPEGETSPSTTKVKVVKVGRKTRPRPSTIDKRFQSAIKKGYRTPSGEITPKGIQTYYARQQGQGYGDPGKELKGGQETLKKANELTKNITPEKKKTIKSIVKKIETKYPTPEPVKKSTPLGFKSFSQSIGTGAQKRAQAASDAAKDIKTYENERAFHKRVLQAVKDLPAEKSPVKIPKPTAKPKIVVKAKPTVKPKTIDLGTTKIPELPKIDKGAALKVSTPSVTKAASSVDDIANAASKVIKQVRADKAAATAAKELKTAKAWKAAGRLAGGVAAAYDAKTGYDTARTAGASQKRALGAGAARAVGGLLGGAVGSTVGSAAGLPGAVIGGTAGYTAGAELASKAYDKVTGDYGKKLTTKGVLTNIRTAVPKEIRAQVPAGARKAFRDLVTQTGRTYGNWSRSQEAKK